MQLTMENLATDLKVLHEQKEQLFQNYHRVCGALALIEQQINKIQSDNLEQEKLKDKEITVDDESIN